MSAGAHLFASSNPSSRRNCVVCAPILLYAALLYLRAINNERNNSRKEEPYIHYTALNDIYTSIIWENQLCTGIKSIMACSYHYLESSPLG